MKFLRHLFTLTVLLSFLACDKKSDASETDNLFAFKEYISYNTNNLISIADPIRIVLSKPLEQFELSQEVPSEYLKISPKTEGRLIVENRNTLIFQPSEYLDPNTEYSVTVKLNKLYDDIAREFNNYTFSFKTIQPNYKIDLSNLQSYSKQWQYLEGILEASDVISLENAKKIVAVSQGNKNLNVKWPLEASDAKYFNFTIDSIQREIEDSEINVSWDGKAIKSDNKGESTKLIPGQNNFTVVEIKSTVAPQASLTINFSDPLKENQNFAGLVALESAQNLRFEVDGNVLHVYPSSRIVGNVRVTVFNGIKNSEDYKLKKEFSELISFEQLKPAVRLLSKGVVLPDAASTPLYFEAVNLSAVDVRVIKIFESNMLQFLQGSNLDNTNVYDVQRVGRRVAKKTVNLQDNKLDNDGLWKAHGINLADFSWQIPAQCIESRLVLKRNIQRMIVA